MSLIKKFVLKEVLKGLKQAYSIYYFRNIARMEEYGKIKDGKNQIEWYFSS